MTALKINQKPHGCNTCFSVSPPAPSTCLYSIIHGWQACQGKHCPTFPSPPLFLLYHVKWNWNQSSLGPIVTSFHCCSQWEFSWKSSLDCSWKAGYPFIVRGLEWHNTTPCLFLFTNPQVNNRSCELASPEPKLPTLYLLVSADEGRAKVQKWSKTGKHSSEICNAASCESTSVELIYRQTQLYWFIWALMWELCLVVRSCQPEGCLRGTL